MTALMMKVIKLKRACNYCEMLMRMCQKKTMINYLKTVNGVALMAFKFGSGYFAVDGNLPLESILP